ncbi:MAG: twin-arginine translocation signal domain-containing protein [Chloroflexi bacterium]|nr:twin-arginine translocation signal domain-containing protein [Chloroflexota bacterium]
MNRRDFLKFGGLTSAVLAFPAWKLGEFALAAAQIEYGGRVYRGTQDGEVHVSDDQGQTFSKQVRFGPQYSISKMFTGFDGRLYAQLEYQDRSFFLSLAEDGNSWRLG